MEILSVHFTGPDRFGSVGYRIPEQTSDFFIIFGSLHCAAVHCTRAEVLFMCTLSAIFKMLNVLTLFCQLLS